MKLIVKSIFRDKNDHVTLYEPGIIMEVKDKERAADLIDRGLCAEYKGKKAVAVTLGEETPSGEAEGTEAAPVEKAEEASTEGTTSNTEEAE